MGLHKILKIVAAIIGVIGVVLAAIVWLLDGEALKAELKDVGIQAMDVPGSITNIMNVAFVVLAIVLVLVLIFVLKGLFTGNAKNALIGIGAFLLVIVISYFLAPSEGPQELVDAVAKNLKDTDKLQNMTATEVEETTMSTIKWVGTSLNAFYILGATAIGIMAFTGVKKLVK